MYLNDYLDKLKKNKLEESNKPWLTSKIISDEFFNSIFPDEKVEEWKNFNIKSLIGNKLKVLEKNKNLKIEKINRDYNNILFFNNGVFEKCLLEKKLINKINIYKTTEYKKKDKTILKKIYSDAAKYAEKRLSGVSDSKTTKLLSLNALLSEGVVIEIPNDTVIDNQICIYNNISCQNTLVNPYILIIAKENSKTKFLDLTSYNGEENWTNSFYEIYLEKNSNFQMANLSTNQIKNVNTSSYNFHLEKYSRLKFSSINKGNSKKDIRVFLNGENSKTSLKGMLISKHKESNDIFCKVTHNAPNTISNQEWRMLSSDNSKTSLNGKIKILKNAKKSTGSFFSKTLLLSEKAKSFSKPELEIFEDEVSCSHGASFGEIEKEKVFYLQSRGLSKRDAIKFLVLAFINELKLNDDKLNENILSETENLFC